MRSVLPYLRLVRVGTLFSPAADVVASLAVAGLPWTATAARAIAAGVCLYACGMVWNDVADRRIDAVHRPERPLPSGKVPLPAAVTFAVALAAAGIAVSPCRLFHAVVLALVLAYDFALKKLDWLGVFGMATLRTLNLGTALALAEVGEPRATALRVAAACYGAYIAAVTVLGIFEDRPAVRPRAVAAVQAAPPLAALCGLCAVQGGPWPAPALAALPALWFLRANARQRAFDRARIRGAMTWLLLGTMLYTALLCVAAGRWPEALAIAAVIAPARWIARRIALT